MNVLILGGTTFLGRHLVTTLLEREHAVSIFTRGLTVVPGSAPIVRYVGDRDLDFGALPRDGWDAVIDTSAHRPSWVAASSAYLRRASRYLYTSSVSVYDISVAQTGDGLGPYVPEPAHAVEGDDEAYGTFKRRCEDVVRAVFGPERSLVVRPGLIVGPYDPTNRFTYWVDRAAAGGTILAPGEPADYVQFIDVRDLAAFMVRLLEDERTGIYDVSGRPATTTIGDVLAACTAHAETSAKIVWAQSSWLELHGLEGWMDLPLWLGPSRYARGLMNVRIDRALDAGLTLRSLAETVAATSNWAAATPERARPAGITRERESELLGRAD